jgi:trehalose 6-phosphate phosphatase
MKHLFKAWPDFTAAVEKAPHVLLLADYDGTLTPIVGRPADAKLSASVRQKLVALSQKPDFSVGVISGRELSELKSLVGIEGIYYAGNHGLEIEGPGLNYINPEAAKARSLMQELAARLAEALENISGVIIQEKDYSVSVHYRLVKPEDEPAVEASVRAVTGPHVKRGEVKVYPMKKVWETRPPVDWDKGKAALLIGQEIKAARKLERLLTIYLGDDTTDEDAFRVICSPDGWSVFISGEKKESAAEYCLNSVAEVEGFLGRLIELK